MWKPPLKVVNHARWERPARVDAAGFVTDAADDPVNQRAPRGSSPFTAQRFPTIPAKVASSLSLLRVAPFTAALSGDPWIHHQATGRTEPHRSISTPVIHVGTLTLHHKPLSPLQ